MSSLFTPLPAGSTFAAGAAARGEPRGTGSTQLARLALLALLWSWLCGTSARAALREYDVKAAFLYNFATFGEWPDQAFPTAHTPFVIGVLGTDPFDGALEQIVAGERIQGRPIVVRRFGPGGPPPDCQILFVSASERWHVREILRECRDRPILTVADMPGFVEAGGMVDFATTSRVGLKINPRAVQRAQLGLSPKLLRLAQVVSFDPVSS